MDKKIKTILIIVAAALVALSALAVVYGNSMAGKAKIAVGEANMLRAELDAKNKAWKAQTADSDRRILELEGDSQRKDEVILRERSGRQASDARLAEVLASIKVMSDDETAKRIGKFVGEYEIAAMAGGMFHLTRPGADKDLELLLQGENDRNGRASAEREAAAEKAKAENCGKQREEDGKKYVKLNEAYTTATASAEKEREARVKTERAAFGLQVKAFLRGLGIGALGVFLAHVFGLIK